MAVIYSVPAITGRLNGLVTAIGAGGLMLVSGGGVLLSTIPLATPCGTVNLGVLTFTGGVLDPAAAGTGNADTVQITDSTGTLMISGFTVGIPLSGADIILSNGLNSLLISAGQSVSLLSGQIIGS